MDQDNVSTDIMDRLTSWIRITSVVKLSDVCQLSGAAVLLFSSPSSSLPSRVREGDEGQRMSERRRHFTFKMHLHKRVSPTKTHDPFQPIFSVWVLPWPRHYLPLHLCPLSIITPLGEQGLHYGNHIVLILRIPAPDSCRFPGQYYGSPDPLVFSPPPVVLPVY